MLKLLFTAAWSYRGFIRSSIANEVRGRLARSRFGTAWLVLHPLAQVAIFATILSNVLAARLQGVDNQYAYAVYLIAGMLCWNLFVEIVQRCRTVFIDQAPLLRKMNFPRITLPLIVVGSAMVNSLALLVAAFVILPILGFQPELAWLWLPLLLLITAALAAGIGLLLGTLNVFSRDVGQVTAVVLQFWFWVTPIVYPVSIVPEAFRSTLALNPLVPLVGAYQQVIVYGRPPSLDLLTTAGIAMVLVALALIIFRRASSELVDAL